MYIITASCWRRALQPRSCPPFYPDSVCPESARRRTVWKLPSVVCVRAFRGGLQARLWQVKIGVWSFVTRFLQVAHRVARENSFALREIRHTVLGLRERTKRVRQMQPCRSVCVHTCGDQPKDVSKIDQRKGNPRKKNWKKEKKPKPKGKTVATSHRSKKMYRFRFLGKENPKNTQCVSAITQIQIETDIPRKAYCSPVYRYGRLRFIWREKASRTV